MIPYLSILSPAPPARYDTTIAVSSGRYCAALEGLARDFPSDRFLIQAIEPLDSRAVIVSTTSPDIQEMWRTIDLLLDASDHSLLTVNPSRWHALSQATSIPKKEASTMDLKKAIFALDRASIVNLLADESIAIDDLRAAVFVLVGGNPADLMAVTPTGAPAVAPVATAPAPKPAAQRRTTAAAPATPANGAAAPDAVTTGVLALAQSLAAAGKGFALKDAMHVTGATKAQCQRALKNAVAAGQLGAAGERRFSRYGLTAQLAAVQAANAQAGSE